MDSTKFQDHYEVLGVPADADSLEIRRAFRSRVKLIHPDVSADKEGANDAFIRLKEAYNVLSDPEQRSQFDVSRANHRARTPRARAGGPSSGPSAGSSSREPGGWRNPSGPMYPPPGGDTWTRYHRDLTIPDLLQRAMREIAAGRSAYARRDLAEILAREPENPDALVLMGRLYQAEGKMQEWIQVLEEGVRKNPGHVALRLALNEARRSMTVGPIPRMLDDEDRESRRRAYLAGGIMSGAAVMGWGVLARGQLFVLDVLVPVMAPLVTGTMLCALIAGWTMAATATIAPIEDELFFPDTHGRSMTRKNARHDPPLGLAVPVVALLHYFLALGVMVFLMLMRGTVSRSLLIVSATAFALALGMAMAAPLAAGAIMSWCPGWLLFAIFTGWLIGDFFR